ncbi:MAG: DNA alkylation repair protein [Denitrovibrio sp.]|nr:MAG: DNA alkylation repair protein [Denitrovibrio sp.]
MTVQDILNKLSSLGKEDNLKGMSKYGINTSLAYGVTLPEIRAIAKEIGTDQELAEKLWKTGNHEARILATVIADPALSDSDLLDDWVEDINSWDLCDQFCNNLVHKTAFAMQKILLWCVADEPFIKRAGFSTMANYALKQPDLREKDIEGFFSLILSESGDKRNYVRKSVSWALRNIGKRNLHYNRKAVKIAKTMKEDKTKAASETASEAIKELQKSELLKKLKDKQAET